MGWTSYRVTPINGKINRRSECNRLYTWETKEQKYEVLKSSMVGRTYYAAVRMTDKNSGTEKIRGVVVLTTGSSRGYYNFSYKAMSEECGPTEAKCPLSIIEMLSPTDSEWANEWRQRCREYHRRNRVLKEAANGSEFKVLLPERFVAPFGGSEVTVVKIVSGYRGRRHVYWVLKGYNMRLKECDVLQNLQD